MPRPSVKRAAGAAQPPTEVMHRLFAAHKHDRLWRAEAVYLAAGATDIRKQIDGDALPAAARCGTSCFDQGRLEEARMILWVRWWVCRLLRYYFYFRNKYISIDNGGEGGIRTLDRLLTYTHFPGVLLKPLGHLSAGIAIAHAGELLSDRRGSAREPHSVQEGRIAFKSGLGRASVTGFDRKTLRRARRIGACPRAWRRGWYFPEINQRSSRQEHGLPKGSGTFNDGGSF